MAPKVLVAAPTYAGKDYIFMKWYENIQKLTYPNYDWIIVDNSKNMSYVSKLRRRGVKKVYHQPRGGSSRLAIARASEKIRLYAIEHNFDFIMFIETDLLPPRDIIERLLKHEKAIVGAVYEVGIRGSKDAPRRPLLYEAVKKEDGVRLEMLEPEKGYSLMNRGLIQTPACGFGCTLIHKTIFKNYPFKYTSKGKLHTDMLFYWELWNAGQEVYADTDLNILHFNQNWKDVKDW